MLSSARRRDQQAPKNYLLDREEIVVEAGEPNRAMRGRFPLLPIGTVLAVLVFLYSCSKKPEQNLVPVGSPMAESIRFQYAVYMLPTHAKDPSVALNNALVKNYLNLKLVGEIPKE